MSRTSRVRPGQGCGPVQEPNAFLLSWAEETLDDALRRSPLLAARPYEIFAQGSRVNGTYLEQSSDIDLVLMLKTPSDAYGWEEFRDDVLGALGETYSVRMGRRCLNVDDEDSLFGEMVDILVATEHRHYPVPGVEFYEQGVFFRDVEGRPIVNFPKQHRRNGDEKDLRTGGRFKQVVRAAKRARKLAGDPTPSYLIECLLYNVPDQVFMTPAPYRCAFDRLSRCYREDPVAFAALACQNGINRLFGPGPDQWEPAAAGRIIDVLHTL
ncbi:nucleotidyltransferase [Winogradskya consettensis]|uniref:Nucleotidyltransferase n=1 Tax=Winogradskya consettensis TaxID=113560 RepID=A0A919VZK2_9ACTN|nr:nucleotidyltransferase domain-containing protein [Actinoplanes consettensis]GIM85492.1 nucleotidyltransferase [Actinoplanes consettensis]